MVSGGARGIDFVAHDATLGAGGATVAVLACGVDRVYPAQNRRLLQHLAAELAVVSEQPPGSAPTRPRFLARNRLIAALTTGTVLVEAALRSGALNTAGWAEGLSRQVMGVPGPVTSYTSQGVNAFLRDGRGCVVTAGARCSSSSGSSGEHLLAPPRGPNDPTTSSPRTRSTGPPPVPVARRSPVDSAARLSGPREAGTAAALRPPGDGGVVRRAGGAGSSCLRDEPAPAARRGRAGGGTSRRPGP